ncbi:hypothetical protein [Burkholderia vietnamiensis]|uniref:hypothetical protein n=1 Tax=Burkholderia vietnamiensis TaxID=60552 RepID=UPI0012D8FEB1|nr:hypothetical protein [Burkholderia vietnamiensis]
MEDQEERIDPVPGGESWYRHILTPSEVQKSPDFGVRINPKYFENKLTTPDSEKAVAWRHELSGRLLSRAGSIRQYAEDSLKRVLSPKKEFHGVICSSVEAIRAIEPVGCYDVVHTPRARDKAHADLVSMLDLFVEGDATMVSAEKTKGLRAHFSLVKPRERGYPEGQE